MGMTSLTAYVREDPELLSVNAKADLFNQPGMKRKRCPSEAQGGTLPTLPGGCTIKREGPSPTQMSAYDTDTAFKVLYMSVSWARSIPSFLQLPFQDQALLLEEGWSELFILSIVQ